MTPYNRRMSFSRHGSLVFGGSKQPISGSCDFWKVVDTERFLHSQKQPGGASSAFVFLVPHFIFRRFTSLKTKMDVPSDIFMIEKGHFFSKKYHLFWAPLELLKYPTSRCTWIEGGHVPLFYYCLPHFFTQEMIHWWFLGLFLVVWIPSDWIPLKGGLLLGGLPLELQTTGVPTSGLGRYWLLHGTGDVSLIQVPIGGGRWW